MFGSAEEMGDAYWNRQPPPVNHTPSAAGLLKRPRPSDYDLPQSGPPSAYEMQNYLARDNDRGGPGVVKDTKSIGSAYDRYLQNTQLTSMSSAESNGLGGAGLGRSGGGGGILNIPSVGPIAVSRSEVVDVREMGLIGRRPADALNGRGMGFDSQIPRDVPNGRGVAFDGRVPPVDVMPRSGRETVPLPSDASNTLYVEGLPSNCRKREVAHIFRPFVGYKEVRLVSKESRHRGEPLVLCFVDFVSPACAATAMSALQGYKMDEHDSDSPYLRIQFSKSPGPRSGSYGRR